ncbi:MAG: ribonuclease E activity regulator RraA [Gammaproteobacteria bacterium]|nr:ribonuclease E activity regulator RraA [Gammaproteobacteria bacterium]
MTKATADLYDAHGEALRVAAPLFRDFGGAPSFEGPVATCKVFEDNSLVRAALEEPGNGRVLVVDGGGSLRCALVGDMLGALGRKNGWAGIVVYGCVRDAHALGEIPIGIKAIATNPRKSVKKGEGERDVLVRFADVAFKPGDYLYADRDGIVIADAALP